MKTKYHYNSPIGMLCVEIEDNTITGLYLDSIIEENEQETNLHAETHRQLMEYFHTKSTKFDLPIRTAGTAFQVTAKLDSSYC